MFMQVLTCMCGPVCGGQRSTFSISLHLIFETGYLTELYLLVNELQESVCLYFPVCGIDTSSVLGFCVGAKDRC